MDIVAQSVGSVTVLAVSGRVDTSTAKAFETRVLAVLDQRPTGLLFDLSALEFISSAGLRVLLVAAKKSKAAGHGCRAFGLRPIVSEVFTMGGFNNWVPTDPDQNSALAALT